jgi:hypothetical protein
MSIPLVLAADFCHRYYANFFGYECEDIDVETEDGFILRLHHLTSKKHKARTSSRLPSVEFR